MTAVKHITASPNGTGLWTFGREGASPPAVSFDDQGTFLINGVPVSGGASPVLLAPGAAGNTATVPTAGQSPWLTAQEPSSPSDANPDFLVLYSTTPGGAAIKAFWLNGNMEPRSAPSTASRRGWVAYELGESVGGPSTGVYAAFSTNPTDSATRENLLGGYGTGHSTQPGWVVATRVLLAQLGIGFGGTFGTLSQGIWRGRSSSRGAPSSGTYSTGDVVVDVLGSPFICTAGGTPGTWSGGGQETFSDPGVVYATHVSAGSPAFQIARTSSGMLALSGGISLDTTGVASGGTIITLPVGYRPSGTRTISLRTSGGTASAANWVFNTDGTVTCTASLSGGTPTLASFDGLAIRLV